MIKTTTKTKLFKTYLLLTSLISSKVFILYSLTLLWCWLQIFYTAKDILVWPNKICNGRQTCLCRHLGTMYILSLQKSQHYCEAEEVSKYTTAASLSSHKTRDRLAYQNLFLGLLINTCNGCCAGPIKTCTSCRYACWADHCQISETEHWTGSWSGHRSCNSPEKK